jgi:hypothetical protein
MEHFLSFVNSVKRRYKDEDLLQSMRRVNLPSSIWIQGTSHHQSRRKQPMYFLHYVLRTQTGDEKKIKSGGSRSINGDYHMDIGVANFSELRKLAKLHPRRIGCFTRSKLPGLSAGKSEWVLHRSRITFGESEWVLYQHGMILGASIGDGSIYALRNGFDKQGNLIAVPNLNRRLA